MPWKALLLAACLAPLSGCLLAEHTARNLFNEPAELMDNKKVHRQFHREAKTVYEQVCRQYPQRTFTVDFFDGFVAGYVDFLESGGTCQPPALPPLKYRRSKYMSVEGHAQIQDYFCGFKYGCEVAAASGKRELVTVPILLPEPPAEPPVQARQVITEPAKIAPKASDLLPKPKAADMGTGLPLLDRPLAAQPATPSAPPPLDAPTVTIPVIDPPPGPRTETPVPDPVIPTAFTPSPVSAPGSVQPLREIPNSMIKPLRTIPNTQPIPPWRGD